MQKLTLEVPIRESIEDDCPSIPEGATHYEAQEINRLWSMAIGNYRDAILRIADSMEEIAEGVPSRNPYCNDVQHLAMAIGAHQALGSALDGVHHRLAMDKRHERIEAGEVLA